ncbi:nucleic-acid-binding protein from transposon X-element [Trichonephila clavipes]|uniref:Nucleic-acid-binding protein from transposon X-element n=1 Tax=Trichonephila clavipes TaxID=2585209 RepID=A0A8X7BLJ5_TRICX|nr:nucleic-acid-binding protein from transposon X-element [Trichonephila clavipes]
MKVSSLKSLRMFHNAHPQKDEGAFQLVKGRKKGRSPTPPKDTSTKKLKTVDVETSNKYDALVVPHDEENEDVTGASVNHNVVRPPPPNTIDNVNLPNQLLKKLQETTQQKLRGRMVGKGLRIYPETPEAYHAIRRYIDTEKLEAFTYQLLDEKELKAVIRGMPADTPPQEIIDLLTVGITVNECQEMTNRKTGLPMPLFLITLPRNKINKDIFNMTELCYLKIKVEPLRPKLGPAQCFRCQGFYHSSKFCTRNPKCVKCGQTHLTRNCTKTSETDATCCNCQDDFLENIDHNLAYYEIPAQLACAYLKGHLKGQALDWFEVLGYRVIEDKTTDYAHLKQALSEQFPVVRNRSELETRFYSSSQRRDQQPSDFIYELLKIHKVLKLEMSEEKLIDHVISRLEPEILDYVEVRHPRNTANLLQIVDKYEERFMHRQIRGSSEGFRSSGPNEGNRFNTRHRQENWRENGNNERYANNSRPQREFNRFENQGFTNNRRFEGRRQGGQSDQRFHNQGGRQNGSRNSSFQGRNERSRNLNF